MTINFGETVTGFDLADLTLVNLAASNLLGGANGVYTFDVVAAGNGEGSILLPTDMVDDLGGNGNTPETQVFTTAATARPEFTLVSVLPLATTDQFEAVLTGPSGSSFTGQDASLSVAVTNASVISTQTSGVTLRVRFGPTSPDSMELRIDGGLLRFVSGNLSPDQGPFDIGPFDTTAPSVTLSGGPATLNNTNPFTVTATFNEDVTGFDDLANDITVTNASVTAISGGPSVYTLTATPTGAGDVAITVPAAAAKDAATNDNTASNTLVIGNTIVEDTQKLIAGFMLGRAGNLASNQPGLTRFLQGTGCGSFNANATEGSGSVNGCVSQGNVRADLNSSWSGDSSYTLGSFGAHGFVNPNLLIGGLLQLDYADDDANDISGTGWMVGPYFVAQVPDQPLFFEGRLLYGQTDNDISPLGTYTDSFDTERMLAQLRATGEYKYQATTLMPLFDLTYTDDEAQTYTDSLGNVIPGQKISLVQVTAGMDFSTPIAVQSGALDITGGLSAIHASTKGGNADFEGTRGLAELGLSYGTEFGGNISVGTLYDGIGSDYQSWGANLSFDMKF